MQKEERFEIDFESLELTPEEGLRLVQEYNEVHGLKYVPRGISPTEVSEYFVEGLSKMPLADQNTVIGLTVENLIKARRAKVGYFQGVIDQAIQDKEEQTENISELQDHARILASM